jgi:methylmalonyl-CoA carboxyltransferase 5S subunit
MLGYYGETAGVRDPHVIQKAAKFAKKELIRHRPADLLKPEWDNLRSQAIALKGCNGSDEDVLTYAMFPQVAPKFFLTRDQGPKSVARDPAAQQSAAQQSPAAPKPSGATNGSAGPVQSTVKYDVTVNGKTHHVTVTPV